MQAGVVDLCVAAGVGRYVRDVIHAFNEEGFAALDPKWSGGRPSKTDEATRERIGRIGMSPVDESPGPTIGDLPGSLVAVPVNWGGGLTALIKIQH
jgi:hypothetical protein